jgi:hypothetical protein
VCWLTASFGDRSRHAHSHCMFCGGLSGCCFHSLEACCVEACCAVRLEARAHCLRHVVRHHTTSKRNERCVLLCIACNQALCVVDYLDLMCACVSVCCAQCDHSERLAAVPSLMPRSL